MTPNTIKTYKQYSKNYTLHYTILLKQQVKQKKRELNCVLKTFGSFSQMSSNGIRRYNSFMLVRRTNKDFQNQV